MIEVEKTHKGKKCQLRNLRKRCSHSHFRVNKCFRDNSYFSQ